MEVWNVWEIRIDRPWLILYYNLLLIRIYLNGCLFLGFRRHWTWRWCRRLFRQRVNRAWTNGEIDVLPTKRGDEQVKISIYKCFTRILQYFDSLPYLFPDSDYTVNAMDVEELRRSQRRVKKPRSSGTDLGMSYTLNPPSSTVSVSGSQDSEDDDDEVSTPSGELAERNLLSLLSVR